MARIECQDLDIYGEIDLEDLHGPAEPTTIALEVGDADEAVNGDTSGPGKGVINGKTDEVSCNFSSLIHRSHPSITNVTDVVSPGIARYGNDLDEGYTSLGVGLFRRFITKSQHHQWHSLPTGSAVECGRAESRGCFYGAEVGSEGCHAGSEGFAYCWECRECSER